MSRVNWIQSNLQLSEPVFEPVFAVLIEQNLSLCDQIL